MKINTKDRIVEFRSLMGNYMIPTTTASAEKYACFLSDCCKKNEKIELKKKRY